MEKIKINWANLVKGVRKNDPEYMADFIELNQDVIMRFCLYLTGNRQLAEDICHDTFVRAFESIEYLKKPEQCRAWLKKIARNLFLDYKKSAAQSKPHIDIDGDDPGLEQRAGLDRRVGANASDMQILAMQALQILEEKDRVIVILIDVEGHTYSEVSEIFKTAEGTIKSRVSRARQKMLEFIETNRPAESSNKGEPKNPQESSS